MPKKDIQFQITLDNELIPEGIIWENSDDAKARQVKSLFVSGWDEKENSSLTFNIWTKDMRVDEMHHLYVQTLISLTDGFQKATGNEFVHEDMRTFLQNFEKKIAASGL
ncbi:MAG: hypothetical protein KTR13_03675 [Saprospiraceae bacterium]|nr:hypothetical protein [Saprospiraceae bacterium]